MALQLGGAIDLASGAMLFVLATGLGVVAPAVVGGFFTAFLVALSGAVNLGVARSLAPGRANRAALIRGVLVAVARLLGAIGGVLVLVSATGVVALIVVTALSLVITAVTVALLAVEATAHRHR